MENFLSPRLSLEQMDDSDRTNECKINVPSPSPSPPRASILRLTDETSIPEDCSTSPSSTSHAE